jgi:hypothetical protein
MANTYAKILYSGKQAAYDALSTKDSNILYFCEDSGKIYKGEVDYTNNVIAAASKPSTPVAGKIYILADTNTVEVYVNDVWKVLSYPTVTEVTAKSTDVEVASAKAVYDAIQAAVEEVTGGDSIVKTLEAGESDATLKVTKGDGSTSNVTVPGVVTTPTWDSTLRKLTLPVAGGTSVEVNIGKDIFVDPEKDNKYNTETKNIELYLNDGTKIEIPASDLVDVYTGTTANGTSTTVGDDNTIKVDLVVDPAEGNAVVVTESGIKVDLTAYAKSKDVEDQISGVQDDIDEVKETADANKTAIAKLNGTATEEGSVAKAVKDAVDPVAERVSTLESDNTTNKENIQANSDNIDSITEAIQWGTF